MLTNKYEEYCGEIVIDNLRRRDPPRRHGYFLQHETPEEDESSSEEDDYQGPSLGENGLCPILDTRAPPQLFHSFAPRDYTQLTPDHYFLFPRRLNGFALASKHKSRLRLGHNLRILTDIR
ncbi:MAG: hypothetical protein CL912_16650 [Deltaproteobacteria bacterium]|nr:hypothetical protein [Deltaproteobacteria bacterium]|tara:strand:+ start:722 stop:1084 length:363 start_codon:yes stop_codon:yes gene_type:complete